MKGTHGDEGATWVGELIDAYAADTSGLSVAMVFPADGVPLTMRAGEIDADGWVEWRVRPSTLGDDDVDRLEAEYRVQFPPAFRAFFQARFHLFDQVHSRRHDQLVLMPSVPEDDPLGPIRGSLAAWRPLIAAGYIPFAEWGDGWGPMCFDADRRDNDGDCPIVWLDHEALHALGPDGYEGRETLVPLARPLYASCREFLLDVFGVDSSDRT